MLSIAHLMEAAREARKASVGGKIVTIAICEDGFVVHGAKDGKHAAIDIGWPDMDINPALLANAVLLISERV